MMGTGYTWNEWSRHIIEKLIELNADIKELEGKVSNTHDDLIELKVKIRVLWGTIGTLLGSLVTLVILILAGVL
jgi:hypothetical protein